MAKINRVAGPTDDFLTPGTPGAAVREDAEDLTDADRERSDAENGPEITEEARGEFEDWERRSGLPATALRGPKAGERYEVNESAPEVHFVHEGVTTSAGTSSSKSDDSPLKSNEKTESGNSSTAHSTVGRSNKGQRGSSTASSADTSSK